MKVPASWGWVLSLWALWLIVEFIVFGKFSVVYTWDNGEVILPGLISTKFAGIDAPLWDNFSAAGSDRISEGWHGGIDVWLFSHLPGWLAYQLRVVSLAAIPVFAVYGLSHLTFRFSPWAKLYCAGAYSLTLTPGILMLSVHAYVPAVLFALTWLFQRIGDVKRWLIAVVAVFLLAETAYFSQLVPFAGAVIVFWFLFVDTRRTLGEWAVISVAVVAPVAMRIGDIRAMLATAPESHAGLVRAAMTTADAIDATIAESVFLSTPIMTVCTALFVYALIVRRGGSFRMKAILAAIVLGAVTPLAGTIIQGIVAEWVPAIHGYNLFRLRIVVITILVFAGGYGIQELTNQIDVWNRDGAPVVRIRLGQGALGLAVLAVAWVSVEQKVVSAREWIIQGSYKHNFESPVFQGLADSIKAEPWPVRAETFQMYPRYLNAYGIETAGGYQALIFRRYFEFWDRMMDPWMAGFQPTEGGFQIGLGGNRFAIAGGRTAYRNWRLMLVPPDHAPELRLADLYRLKFLSLANVAYIVSRDRLLDESLELLRQPDMPWSSMSTRERIATNAKANFTGRTHLYVYRNRNSLPRFFTVKSVRLFDSGEEVLDAMVAAPLAKLRHTVFAERATVPEPVAAAGPYGDLEIVLKRYVSDEIRLDVRGDGAAVLVIANAFSSAWKAEIDGVPATIFPADHAFWGVYVPAGARSIRFRYDPL